MKRKNTSRREKKTKKKTIGGRGARRSDSEK
jgi:hypothetical protein